MMPENNSHRIEDELAKTNRRLEELSKKVDLLYQDREILENVVGRLTSLEEQVKLSRQHDDIIRRDIKNEFNIVGDRLIAKLQGKVDEMESLFKRKQRTKDTRPFWKRLLRRK